MAREPLLHVFVDNSNVLIEARRFAEMKRKTKAKLTIRDECESLTCRTHFDRGKDSSAVHWFRAVRKRCCGAFVDRLRSGKRRRIAHFQTLKPSRRRQQTTSPSPARLCPRLSLDRAGAPLFTPPDESRNFTRHCDLVR